MDKVFAAERASAVDRITFEKDHGAEIECHFCRTKYHFTEQDLEELKLEARTV